MSKVICPGCKHTFELSDAMRNEVQAELRSQMVEWQRKKEEEFRNKEAGFSKQLAEAEEKAREQWNKEKLALINESREKITKEISANYANKLQLLQEENESARENLEKSRKAELEFLRKEQALVEKEQQLEIQLHKQLIEQSRAMRKQIQQEELEKASIKEEELQLKLKEMEEKFEQQKKLAEEMKRKAEQGSMQAQGEAQELLLEEILQAAFPFDSISEVGKGVRGADCMLTVRNNMGQDCGYIIFESKRTKDFNKDWIEKLKTDMRSSGADIALLVTQAMPKEMDRFGEREGVWICSFAEVRALVHLMREHIIRIYAINRSQENKGDKMTMLYDFLTGKEFQEQWKAIREGFMAMQRSIMSEKVQMEKLWKVREKQLEKVLLNMASFTGSIQGIAGKDFDTILLDDYENQLLD